MLKQKPEDARKSPEAGSSGLRRDRSQDGEQQGALEVARVKKVKGPRDYTPPSTV